MSSVCCVPPGVVYSTANTASGFCTMPWPLAFQSSMCTRGVLCSSVEMKLTDELALIFRALSSKCAGYKCVYICVVEVFTQ